MDEEEAIRQFLGDRPRADQLSEWRGILEQRLEALLDARERAPKHEAAELDRRIASLRKQIAALIQEEGITRFVEDSVRATLHMGAAAERADPGSGDLEELKEQERWN